MANLDDLGFTSLTSKSTDESLETLRQIRLARRDPVKAPKTTTKKVKLPELTAEQAANILKTLGVE
jgi:hypothetical protein